MAPPSSAMNGTSVAQWLRIASRSDTSPTTHQPLDLFLRATAQRSVPEPVSSGSASMTSPSGASARRARKVSAPGIVSVSFLPLAEGWITNTASAGDFFGSITYTPPVSKKRVSNVRCSSDAWNVARSKPTKSAPTTLPAASRAGS